MDELEHNVLRGKYARWDVLCRIGIKLIQSQQQKLEIQNKSTYITLIIEAKWNILLDILCLQFLIRLISISEGSPPYVSSTTYNFLEILCNQISTVIMQLPATIMKYKNQN